MNPNPSFLHKSPEFWANIKLLNQRLGYYKGKFGFMLPSPGSIIDAYRNEGLNPSELVSAGRFTDFGNEVFEYFKYRADVLNNIAHPNLMNVGQAKVLFESLCSELNPKCPIPLNKQKGEKKAPAYLTGITNILIEHHLKGLAYNFDPRQLTAITRNDKPVYVLSRRVDGAFPDAINPIAIVELKEYYYTTTFGSRIADGVYETQLDGWELLDLKEKVGAEVEHLLIVDDLNTWWNMGKSYLCRLIDSMHMGLVDEVIFGKEVVERIPIIVERWKQKYQEQGRN